MSAQIVRVMSLRQDDSEWECGKMAQRLREGATMILVAGTVLVALGHNVASALTLSDLSEATACLFRY